MFEHVVQENPEAAAPAPNVACTKSIAFWIRFSSACSAASVCAVPSSTAACSGASPSAWSSSTCTLAAYSRSPRFFLGCRRRPELLFEAPSQLPAGQRFSFAAESGLFADCTLDRKLTRLPVSAFFCRKVFSSRETACSKNSVAARRASKSHSPQLRRGGCHLPRQNVRKVDSLPTGGK